MKNLLFIAIASLSVTVFAAETTTVDCSAYSENREKVVEIKADVVKETSTTQE